MKKTIITSVLIILLLAVLVFIYWYQRGDALLVQPPSDFKQSEDIVDNQPNNDFSSQIKQTIKNFMNDQSLNLTYVNTSKSPSNFSIGKVTVIGEGAWRMDTPDEWQRPVYIFDQQEYIDDLCEVYQYEIDARNGNIVEVHVVYPQDTQQLTTTERQEKCQSYGSLYTPLKTEEEIKSIAMDYLSRNVDNFEAIQDDFTYTPSTKDAVNMAAAHEWIWQDTSYQLPEGLTGDVYNYPTIRIIFSSGGKLIAYFNTVGLFED